MIRDPWKPQNLLISQLLGRNKKIASIGPIRIPIWHSLQKIKFLALAVWSGPFRGSKNRRSPSNTKKPVLAMNYQADLFQILHETFFGDFKWDSRGTFLIFDLEPLVRGTPGGPPDFNNYLISGVTGRK